MRILICGVAAVALSGCSWLGYTTDGYSNGNAYGGSHSGQHVSGGHYNPQVQSGQYSAGAYDSGAYQYPIAQTYPQDFDPNGPLVGNTMYSAGHDGTSHSYPAPQHSGTRHGGHKGHYAGPRENPWTVNGSIGADFTTGGGFFRGQDAAGAGYNNVSMDEAFKPGIRAELGAARSLRGNRMLTGQAFWAKSEGERVTLRNSATPVRGTFTDHESYGAELGLRQYVTMPASTSYKPYVEGRLGAAYIDDIGIEDQRAVTAPERLGRNFNFIEGGWVPTGAALIGVERPVTRNVMLGLETGIRYSGGLDGAAIPNSTALPGANQYDERWSVPVSLRGRYRF